MYTIHIARNKPGAGRSRIVPSVSRSLSVPAVPCYRRCHQMEVLPENEKIIKLDQGDEEGWVDTHHGIGEVGRVEVGRGGEVTNCATPPFLL